MTNINSATASAILKSLQFSETNTNRPTRDVWNKVCTPVQNSMNNSTHFDNECGKDVLNSRDAFFEMNVLNKQYGHHRSRNYLSSASVPNMKQISGKRKSPNKDILQSRKRCRKSEIHFPSSSSIEPADVCMEVALHSIHFPESVVNCVTNNMHYSNSDASMILQSSLADSSNTKDKPNCLGNYEPNNDTISDILQSLETTLGNILEYVMKNEFGDLWLSIIKHKPPWTLRRIFSCWKNHWLAIFMDKFPPVVEKLVKTLEVQCFSKNIKNSEEMLEAKCLDLYNYFKNEPYCNFVQKLVSSKQSIAKSCSNFKNVDESVSISADCSVMIDPVLSINTEMRNINKDLHNSDKALPASSSEVSHTAQDLIVATGCRMRQFV